MMRRSPNRNPVRRRLGRNALIYAIIALIAIWVVGSLVSRGTEPRKLRFDTFISKVDDGEIKSAEMFLNDRRIRGELKDGTPYQTTFAGDGDTLSLRLTRQHVRVTPNPQEQSALMSLLTQVLPFVL